MSRTPTNYFAAATTAVTFVASLAVGGSAAAVEPATNEAITLTLGTDDSAGVPSADQILHFASEVSRLSNGAVVIEPRWHAEGEGHSDWDQAVARLVQDGDLDLALGPTSAWDVLGVTSLRPMQSPFLVDSDELVAEVVTDDELAGQLMSGLSAAGVEGIAMWPEGLRHPFGFEAPLTSVDDFDGQVIRSPVSETITAVFGALGASTTPETPDASTMAGMQSEFVLSPNGIGAANITFFPKVNLLYANADVYQHLDTATRDVLSESAAATQSWAIEHTDEIAAGAAFCDEGGTIIHATDDDVSALRAATKPVADDIAAAHGDVVAAIAELKQGLAEAPSAAPCGAPPDTEHVVGTAESALNGTYRFTITAQEILDAGGSEEVAFNNEGVQTFVLEDGQITYRLDPTGRPADATDVAHGTYEVDGDLITHRFPTFENEVDTFRFEVVADGDLNLTLLETNADFAIIEVLAASKTWDRIE